MQEHMSEQTDPHTKIHTHTRTQTALCTSLAFQILLDEQQGYESARLPTAPDGGQHPKKAVSTVGLHISSTVDCTGQSKDVPEGR